uniref:Uncharacterized protein n=1 Tax=Plectus sambesii TaxID=2011161 RepID=A0A914UZU1_9BILA
MKVIIIAILFTVVAVSALPPNFGLGLTPEQRQSAMANARQAKASGTSVKTALEDWARANLTPEQQQRAAAQKGQIEQFLMDHKISKRATLGDGQRLAQLQAMADQLKANATPQQLQNATDAKQKIVDALAAHGFTGQKAEQAIEMYNQGKTPAEIYEALKA